LYPSPSLGDERGGQIQDVLQRRGQSYVVGNVVVESDPGAIADCFVREQYRLEGRVEVRRGDTVLDLGAYKGESSIWMASQVGPSGLVLAFEPNPGARAFLERNIARAAGSGIGKIEILAVAAGSSRHPGGFVSTAEGCSRLDADGDISVDVTTVDDIVSEHALAGVDFIKMDIEGGEVEALRGARQTILQYAPRLAISVYHLARDLPEVVAAIRGVRSDYRFFLSHKSPGLAETMLFASIDDGCRP
ncbi:MAG TPA: FkbM family methyltransferase, partial [Clostridia bacterium]|nr:FkbM family methyltransferase [Clostridia bacterium]